MSMKTSVETRDLGDGMCEHVLRVTTTDGKLRWTKECPTKPGWYWAKFENCNPVCVNVIRSGLLTTDDYILGLMELPRVGLPETLQYDWYAGPIEQPIHGNPKHA